MTPTDSSKNDGGEAGTGQREGIRTITLIASGHAVSSFYILSLAPLLPFLKAEFGVSYTLLGAMLSLRSLVSGALQMPVGILVDRIGGKRMLTGGLLLMSAGFGCLALAPSIWWCMAAMVLFGIGISTMRPSNYAIIVSSIPVPWMGRAFGLNIFGGHVGRSIAPPLMVALTAIWGWRAAVFCAATIGLAVSVAIISQWRLVSDHRKSEKEHAKGSLLNELGALASGTTLLFFMFYLLNAVASNGMHSFFIVAVHELHATPLAIASSALTGYLIASAAGVLLGGFLVDQTGRHTLIATLCLLGAAVAISTLGAVSLPFVLLTGVIGVAGALQGAVRPARDLLLRDAMPKESFGKAAGIVTTGASIGSATSPLLFGYIMDAGAPQLVFYIIGVVLLVVVATVIVPKAKVRATA